MARRQEVECILVEIVVEDVKVSNRGVEWIKSFVRATEQPRVITRVHLDRALCREQDCWLCLSKEDPDGLVEDLGSAVSQEDVVEEVWGLERPLCCYLVGKFRVVVKKASILGVVFNVAAKGCLLKSPDRCCGWKL